MSVPRDILDQLLSGYLDDVLSEDERNQVDALLRDDADVARELEELRRLRSSLRDISRTDSHVRLDDGFADRVLCAAIAQGQTEGLGEDHPLIRLAEQPSTEPSRRVSWTRIASAIAVLAASIVVAVFAIRPDQGGQPIDIASVEKPVQPPEIVNVTPDVTPNVIPQADPGEAMIANSDADKAPITPVEVSEDPIQPDTVTPPENVIVKMANPTLDTLNGANSKLLSAADLKAADGLASMFIINVQQTESGRLSHAVRNAMTMASIKAAEEKELTGDMVGFVGETVAKDNESTQVIYLEASAKNIDVLVNRLVADEEGVESVGLSVTFTAPVRQLFQSINPVDPTAIRHNTTWNLQGKAVGTLTRELNSQMYFPITGGEGLPLTAPANQDGPDQKSQVLILIR